MPPLLKRASSTEDQTALAAGTPGRELCGLGEVVIFLLEAAAIGLGLRREAHHELKRSGGFAAAATRARRPARARRQDADGICPRHTQACRVPGAIADSATAEDLRRFQLAMVDHGATPATIKSTLSAFQFFLDVTLGRGELIT